jgi:ferredoxin
MKFRVDLNQCENHGQCTIAAPELFSLNDDGLLAFRDVADEEYLSGELTAEEEASASVAVDMCPMQAISLTA